MKTPRRHGNETLRRIGVGVMVIGLVAALLPAPAADPFSTVHELYELSGRQLWWWFGGITVLALGNTLRLIGAQGHPGLPWPLFRPVDHDALARWVMRKRFEFHRRHPDFTLRRRWRTFAG